MVMKIEKTWIPFISEIITAVTARVPIAEYVVFKKMSIDYLKTTVRLYFQTAERCHLNNVFRFTMDEIELFLASHSNE